ncbi:DUF1671-domain-containing protein [Auriscalpium vulgare]|uniref:DUF1671-domain-containing protein n=1 Tax=Auriscalpium vulgare TaxID=40419 RepID=A0ACB8RVW8_9AGAM|nr:DUF1671-domain-containing protein [Auriscalpium vulgare]
MHDSDIEVVAMTASPRATKEPLRCQVCHVSIEDLSVDRRQAHYEKHFGDAASSSSSKPSTRKPSSSSKKPLWISRGPNKDLFWYSSLESQPPHNYTPGLIPFLKKTLATSVERNHTRRAVLCYDRAVHIYHEQWDTGWGCGYRNFLMACTALMDQQFQDLYFSLLDASPSPSVENLKALIEEAWKAGFDVEGAKQLKRALVGQQKWIGTAELYVAFTYRGIPCQLADFHLPGDMISPLLDWIKNYFSPPKDSKHSNAQDAWRGLSPVIVTDRMPIILQHQGHSRTVVGYEITKTGSMNLLMFDPSRRIPDNVREAVLSHFHKSEDEPPMQGASISNPKNGTAQRLMHSIRKPFTSQGKRRASPLSPQESTVKRIRAGSIENDDDDVVVITSDEELAVDQSPMKGGNGSSVIGKARVPHDGGTGRLDVMKTLKIFRLEQRKLASKEKYQILWFPMGDPLSDAQKRERIIVTSDKIC